LGELILGCNIFEVGMNNAGSLPVIFICTSHDGAAAIGDLKQAVSCVHKSANLAELQHAIRKHDICFRVFIPKVCLSMGFTDNEIIVFAPSPAIKL
jgi:hypothetical protein